MKTTAQRINQTSGNVEYYTPLPILTAARELMGGIDLDPFSSKAANCRVRARRFFSIADDGFERSWDCASLFMNHPFGRATNPPAIEKLLREIRAGQTRQALCLTYACTSEAWFRPLLAQPQCYLYPRTNYVLPDGSVKPGVTKGSVVTYFGPDLARFRLIFAPLGAVKI